MRRKGCDAQPRAVSNNATQSRDSTTDILFFASVKRRPRSAGEPTGNPKHKPRTLTCCGLDAEPCPAAFTRDEDTRRPSAKQATNYATASPTQKAGGPPLLRPRPGALPPNLLQPLGNFRRDAAVPSRRIASLFFFSPRSRNAAFPWVLAEARSCRRISRLCLRFPLPAPCCGAILSESLVE